MTGRRSIFGLFRSLMLPGLGSGLLLAIVVVSGLAQTEVAPYEPPDTIADLSGEIVIDGSSTVYPISDEVAVLFGEVAPDVDTIVDFSGTTGGFSQFCEGEIEIVDASREITDEEIQACTDNGVEHLRLTVASDGITVVVNHQSTFIDCLTTGQLELLWMPDSDIDRWSDLNPEWPDHSIERVGPGPLSGKFDYFTEAILGESGRSTTDYFHSENDLALVDEVAGEKDALGYFGYSYYEQNLEDLRAVPIDNGNGCIAPSPASIVDETYSPLSRPLFIYVNMGDLQRPEVAEFTRFYLANVRSVTSDLGFVSRAVEEIAGQQAALEEAIAARA